MKRIIVIATALAALAAPAAALGGGWATVGMQPPPGDLSAGETWKAELDVRQHGVTPLDGVEPMVHARNRASGERLEFRAWPGERPGIYVASVEIPSPGRWQLDVDDGFGGTHGMPALTVRDAAAGAAGGSAGGDWLPPLLLALGLAALGALALRRLRPWPRSA